MASEAGTSQNRFGLPLGEVSTRVRELGALWVAVLRKLDQLCVVSGGFRAFAVAFELGLRNTPPPGRVRLFALGNKSMRPRATVL